MIYTTCFRTTHPRTGCMEGETSIQSQCAVSALGPRLRACGAVLVLLKTCIGQYYYSCEWASASRYILQLSLFYNADSVWRSAIAQCLLSRQRHRPQQQSARSTLVSSEYLPWEPAVQTLRLRRAKFAHSMSFACWHNSIYTLCAYCSGSTERRSATERPPKNVSRSSAEEQTPASTMHMLFTLSALRVTLAICPPPVCWWTYQDCTIQMQCVTLQRHPMLPGLFSLNYHTTGW